MDTRWVKSSSQANETNIENHLLGWTQIQSKGARRQENPSVRGIKEQETLDTNSQEAEKEAPAAVAFEYEIKKEELDRIN